MIASTHLVDDETGTRRSLCGIKDPLPICAVEHVDAHVAGWGMPVCADCLALTEVVDA